MRTTITLDDDIARVAKNLATEQNKTLGEVISQLARKGLTSGTPYVRSKKGHLPTFHVRDDSPPVTLSDVKQAEDDV